MSEASIQGHREISVGTLPAEWVATTLGDEVASIVGGGTPSKDVAEYWGGDIPWASVKDFSGSRLSRTQDYITQEAIKASATNLIPAGTLITPTRMALGRVAVFDCNVAINQDLKAIFPKPTLLRDFLFYWFQGNADRIEAAGTGSTVKGIRLEVLREFGLALPPLPEQQKIAAILTAVDDKLDVIARQIEATQTLKRGLMQTLFSRGVGTQDADGRWVPHAEFKDSEQGRIPQTWRVCQLQDISEFITKGGTPTTYGFDWVRPEDGIPFFRSECVTDQGFNSKGMNFIAHEAHRQMERSEVRPGDVLMTITGNIGRVAKAPTDYATANINQHIARVRVNDGDTEYVYQCLKQDFYAKYYGAILTGQAYPQISLKQVRETPIVLAPLLEQKHIARVLADADVKTALLGRKLGAFQTLKRGLMQKLLTGEWRVSVDTSATGT